jgi:3-hydroxyacyl-CoA dehydrogenase/sugar lactone lactonase YvrE
MSRVAIIGAGVIGSSWADLFTAADWDVAVYDVKPEAVPERFHRAATLEEAVHGADLVQENGPERLPIKQDLLARIAAAASNDTIIASSTSSLLPSLLADGNARADQILVAHPWNPPQIMPLVELVPGPTTRPEITARAKRIYDSLGKVTVPLKQEIPGFVGNRIQKAVLNEARSLVAGNIVDAPGFDTIMQESLGLRWASIGVLEGSQLGGGPAGIRHLLEHVGKAFDEFELGVVEPTPDSDEVLAQQLDAAYGDATNYADRVARRDRITRAVRATVAAEQQAPILYALDITSGTINRVDPTTGDVSVVVSGLSEAPDGLVVDASAGTLTFTNMGVPDGGFEAAAASAASAGEGSAAEPPFFERNGSVQQVPLGGVGHGEQVRTLVERGTFTTGKQITRDPRTGRLYWCDREGRGVWRAEADGSEASQIVATQGRLGAVEPDEDWCVGVAVDGPAGYIYWTQKGTSKGGVGRILRAGLELPQGTTAHTRDDVEVVWDALPEPIDLEIDADAGMLYWTDRGADPDGNSLNRAPLPAAGSAGVEPTVLARGFKEAIGLALDTRHHVAYVSDQSGAIRAVDLASGAEREVAVLPGAGTGLALAWG